MAAKYPGPREALEAYDAALVEVTGQPHRGAANPYSSLNGNMFSSLDKEGGLGIRLGAADREAFIAAFDSHLVEAYGKVMREYVAMPPEMVTAQPELLASWLQRSYAYARTLKAKPTTRQPKRK